MIKLYFGLPRSGKTTLFSKFVLDNSLKILKGRSKYKYICGNVDLKGIPFYRRIKFEWLGQYDTRDCLILIDEATIECDSRNFKVWNKDKTEFFVLHGHYKCDIILFTQIYNRVDKTIRDITNDVYYMWKPLLIGHWFTRYVRIPYGIDIPKKGKDNSDTNGEISMGYYQPSLFDKIFAPTMYRPRYYQYFDSWEASVLPPLPELGYRHGESIDPADFEPEYSPPSDIPIKSYLN